MGPMVFSIAKEGLPVLEDGKSDDDNLFPNLSHVEPLLSVSNSDEKGYRDAQACLLDDISQYELLSSDEERSLGEEILDHQRQLISIVLNVPSLLRFLLPLYTVSRVDGVLVDRRVEKKSSKKTVVTQIALIHAACKELLEKRNANEDVAESAQKKIVERILRIFPQEKIWRQFDSIVAASDTKHSHTELYRQWHAVRDSLHKRYNYLVTSNMRYAISQALSYGDLAEYSSAALEGLLVAPSRWDCRVAKFLTCADQWIVNSIQDEISRNKLIWLPLSFREKIKAIFDLEETEPKKRSQRKRGAKAAAKATEGKRDSEKALYMQTHDSISLDVSSKNSAVGYEGSPLGHFVIDERVNIVEDVERRELTSTIREVFSSLNEREADVLYSRYYREDSLEIIGKRYSITRERVRQIEVQALNKIRHSSRKDMLEPYY